MNLTGRLLIQSNPESRTLPRDGTDQFDAPLEGTAGHGASAPAGALEDPRTTGDDPNAVLAARRRVEEQVVIEGERMAAAVDERCRSPGPLKVLAEALAAASVETA